MSVKFTLVTSVVIFVAGKRTVLRGSQITCLVQILFGSVVVRRYASKVRASVVMCAIGSMCER